MQKRRREIEAEEHAASTDEELRAAMQDEGNTSSGDDNSESYIPLKQRMKEKVDICEYAHL